MKKMQEYFQGCLLGGAIGDALGWPVEFKGYDKIIARYGHRGIEDLVLAKDGSAHITDDTQMTLFTAEGLLRAETRWQERGICHIPSVVYHAYLRWLHTQGYPKIQEKDWIYDGWLLNLEALYNQRAPGHTCLAALDGEQLGSLDNPINNSKGCGGVMRVAPVGLYFPKEEAFQMGAKIAAITHGHPSGYLAAGVFSHIIASIIAGSDLEASVKDAIVALHKYDDHEEVSLILYKALDLASSNIEPLPAIQRLGEGWVAEEALAISVFCSMRYKDDFKRAIISAVNHDGDSDSTGSITGNILGAYLGKSQIPRTWIQQIEMREEITEIADDLLARYNATKEWWVKYPGY